VTDTQLYFAIGLPCLTVMASLVLSMFTISGVREEIRVLRGEMTSKRNELRGEMTSLRNELTAHIKTIVGKLGSMDVEIAKLMDKKG